MHFAASNQRRSRCPCPSASSGGLDVLFLPAGQLSYIFVDLLLLIRCERQGIVAASSLLNLQHKCLSFLGRERGVVEDGLAQRFLAFEKINLDLGFFGSVLGLAVGRFAAG